MSPFIRAWYGNTMYITQDPGEVIGMITPDIG